MFRYETHLHTFPVSKCAKADVRENLEFYKDLGYDGVFITNHFLDGNINIDPDLPYEKRLDFYFSDFDEAVKIGKEIGLKVFSGVEISYKGTDFLIYGIDREWYYKNPQIINIKKTDELKLMMESGALIIQAHPFREAGYINHIRLFPRCIHGAEVINANRSELENHMAKLFAENYDLIEFAGSDNHNGKSQKKLAGVSFDASIESEEDFVKRIKNKEFSIFEVEL